jgi:hypothetical protein
MPPGVARRWADHTPDIASLPARAGEGGAGRGDGGNEGSDPAPIGKAAGACHSVLAEGARQGRAVLRAARDRDTGPALLAAAPPTPAGLVAGRSHLRAELTPTGPPAAPALPAMAAVPPGSHGGSIAPQFEDSRPAGSTRVEGSVEGRGGRGHEPARGA